MRKILATAVREFKATALTKGFIFGTFLLPVIIWGVLGGAAALGLFSQEKPPIQGTVAVIDSTEDQFFVRTLTDYFTAERQSEIRKLEAEERKEQAKEAAEQVGGVPGGSRTIDMAAIESRVIDVEIENAGLDATIESLKDRTVSGDLVAVLVASSKTLEPEVAMPEEATDEERDAVQENRYQLYLAPTIESDLGDSIQRGVRKVVVAHRYQNADIDQEFVSLINKPPRSGRRDNPFRFDKEGESRQSSEVVEKLLPLAPVIFLLIAILTGASYLLMSTVEEKNSRVMEVLLSGISPLQLMWGKVLGQGLVGLVILIVYGGTAIAGAVVFLAGTQLPVASIYWSIPYFFIGYFMYAAIFAAIGSAVNEIREAQSLQGPVMGVIILTVYLAIFAGVNDTNSLLTRVMSFVPISSPFTMPMRIANTTAPPPLWEVLVSVVLGILGVMFFVWAAAKIFRIGVLAYGQPPSLKGLIGWVRQG